MITTGIAITPPMNTNRTPKEEGEVNTEPMCGTWFSPSPDGRLIAASGAALILRPYSGRLGSNQLQLAQHSFERMHKGAPCSESASLRSVTV